MNMKRIQSNIEEKINAYISDNNVTGMVCDHLLSDLNQDGDYWWYLEPDDDDKLTPEDRKMVEDYIRNNYGNIEKPDEEEHETKTIRHQAKEQAKSLIEENLDLYNEWKHTSHNHIWIQVYPDGEVDQTEEVDMNTSHYLSYPDEEVQSILEISGCGYCDCDACASYEQSQDDDIDDQEFYDRWGYNKEDVGEYFAQHLKDYEYYDYDMAENALEAIDEIPYGYFDDEE